MTDLTEQWTRELEAVLDPGKVWKHGVLVAARREIERLRAEADQWMMLALPRVESVQHQAEKIQQMGQRA